MRLCFQSATAQQDRLLEFSPRLTEHREGIPSQARRPSRNSSAQRALRPAPRYPCPLLAHA